LRNYKTTSARRKIISVPEASKLVNSILDSRDRAILMLLFKTGVRRQELANIDLEDVSFESKTIRLKPTPKRSNRIVFFDDETVDCLRTWLLFRDQRNLKNSKALFISAKGGRFEGSTIGYGKETCQKGRFA